MTGSTPLLEQGGRHILALSGGVGGAKLVLGLAEQLNAGELTIVANTADDFEHFGLPVSPDLDTVMYTLAGLSDTQQGWGLEGESWQVMESLDRLGGDVWFRLGDRDLATHLLRAQGVRSGESLTEVTASLCRRMNVATRLLPMSDDPVRTVLSTDIGELDFQHYFVREQCKPRVDGISFRGVDSARPNPTLMEILASPALTAIVICPSNPFVSVDPMLAIPGVREAMIASCAPVIAVSPIVGGAALKGPAAKMLRELGLEVSACSVFRHYGELLDGFIIDQVDAKLASALDQPGRDVFVTDTVMTCKEDKMRLAQFVLDNVQALTQ